MITAGVLMGGIVAFTRNQTNKSQMYMRARVIAQGATLVALSFGVAGTRAFKSFGKEEKKGETEF
jgi:hypothetical protein